MAQAPVENAQEQGQDQQEQGQDGGGVTQAINQAGQALTALQQVFSQNPQFKAEADLAGQLLQGLQQLVQALQGDQGGQGAQGGQGVTTPEAGAAQVKPAL